MRLTNASVCLHVRIRADDIVRVIVITVRVKCGNVLALDKKERGI